MSVCLPHASRGCPASRTRHFSYRPYDHPAGSCRILDRQPRRSDRQDRNRQSATHRPYHRLSLATTCRTCRERRGRGHRRQSRTDTRCRGQLHHAEFPWRRHTPGKPHNRQLLQCRLGLSSRPFAEPSASCRCHHAGTVGFCRRRFSDCRKLSFHLETEHLSAERWPSHHFHTLPFREHR